MVFAGSTFAGTLFSNGSFETGPAADIVLDAGSNAISGWTVTGADIDYTSYWQAFAGTKSIDLNGFNAGGIKQTFPTTAGATYVVTFALSGNPGDIVQYPNGNASPSKKTLTVQADATGAPVGAYSYDTAEQANDLVNMKWIAPTTYSFKARSASTTLTFTSTTAGSFGPAIDNVAVTQTLATGADCKKGGWQNMVDKNGISFRNQGDCVSYYATGEKNLAN